MIRSNDKPPRAKDFTKRRTVDDGLKLADAAHETVWRLYCEVFSFWRTCFRKQCRRHRRCLGEPAACLMRGLPFVPPAQRLAAEKEVVAGGPRRLLPATHLEFVARREPLSSLMRWRAGTAAPVGAGETPDKERMGR